MPSVTMAPRCRRNVGLCYLSFCLYKPQDVPKILLTETGTLPDEAGSFSSSVQIPGLFYCTFPPSVVLTRSAKEKNENYHGLLNIS